MLFTTGDKGSKQKFDEHEEALENIKDAIRLHLEDRIENKEDIPTIEAISLRL
jgi:predicted transcriptional regulator